MISFDISAIIMFALARMKQYRINLATSSNSYTLGLLCTHTHARARVPVAVKKKKVKERAEQQRRGERSRQSIMRVSERLSKHESERASDIGCRFLPVSFAFRGTQLCTLSWSSFTSADESFLRQVPASRENRDTDTPIAPVAPIKEIITFFREV